MKQVTIIPATVDNRMYGNEQRVLKVASYSRVSTNFEEQLTSFELQRTYYTDLILRKKGWVLAGTYADEGISGVTEEKRPDFLKMMRHCERRKIDFIITKSISRFSRDIEVTIRRVRKLKALGIGVYFEKENLNTLEENSEFTLMILASVAQEESNSMSLNIRRAKQMAMENGVVHWNYTQSYGFKRGENGQPQVIVEHAEVITRIYREYLKGGSDAKIAKNLNQTRVKAPTTKGEWSSAFVKKILCNERYCGEVILQKTYIENHRTKKVKTNNGELPKVHIRNNHSPIVTTEIFYAAQNERARRTSKRKISNLTVTEQGKYSSKYALTEILQCHCCGSPLRRTVWQKKIRVVDDDGNPTNQYTTVKQAVWRCIKRFDYGAKYCTDSVTIDEESLHKSIAESIRFTADERDNVVQFVSKEIGKTVLSARVEKFDCVGAEQRINEITNIITDLMKGSGLSENLNMISTLNNEAVGLQELVNQHKEISGGGQLANEMKILEELMEERQIDFEEYNDTLVRQILKSVKLMDANTVEIFYKNGVVHRQKIELGIRCKG